MSKVDELEMAARVDEILNRRPAVGLAVGVVHDGHLEFFRGHGVADIVSNTPVTEDTAFRIGSITKTFTVIAVMQLWEQGLIGLDAPANDYLRTYQLVPANASWQPATVRHLLTHTAGIPEVVHVSDLFHPDWGPFGARPAVYSVPIGERMPSLAAYYHGGLRVVAEPGTAFAYSNHGFATLGQIVEDVSGKPLDRYLREHIFRPLGMADSDLVRSERVASRLATGYVLGPMFEPQYQPDPRVPGMGLGFFRSDAGGHRVVGHDGILPGFHSELLVAFDDGVGVFAFTNGSSGAMAWMPTELRRLLHHLLGVPDEVVRGDVPHHPEIWAEICGRYQLPRRVSDLRGRVIIGGGVEVFVRGGQLMVRAIAPLPALYRGLTLHPDDEQDPYVFRLDLSGFGMSTLRIVFSHEAGPGATAVHADLPGQPLSLVRPPTPGRPRVWFERALGAIAAATTVADLRSPSRRYKVVQT
jgi:CubicO group peptidase (beta-lactamase class C family)